MWAQLTAPRGIKGFQPIRQNIVQENLKLRAQETCILNNNWYFMHDILPSPSTIWCFRILWHSEMQKNFCLSLTLCISSQDTKLKVHITTLIQVVYSRVLHCFFCLFPFSLSNSAIWLNMLTKFWGRFLLTPLSACSVPFNGTSSSGSSVLSVSSLLLLFLDSLSFLWCLSLS